MAKTYQAPFAQTPKTATAVVNIACAIGTGSTPTNTVALVQAGADGAIVTRITAIPRATVTASSLLLFLSKDNGASMFLIDSEVMPAQTVNTTTAINEANFAKYDEVTPLRLAAGDMLYVGSAVAHAAGIVFKAEYTDY